VRAFWFVTLSVSLAACGGAGPAGDHNSSPGRLNLVRPTAYTGMSDASGAVAVSSNLFLVADDEQNKIRLYRSDQGGPAVKEFDLDGFLEVRGKSLEADLEGAARFGDRAFWIGSHGRNKDGKDRPNRCRFFATDLKLTNGEVTLTPVGKPYKKLLADLIADQRFAAFHFAEAATRAPKTEGALNIEGLSATPDGQLLIGFRNPIPQGKALLVPLLNPNEVVAGKSPVFGEAIQLDLGGLGIRDIACHEHTFVIVAGPWHGGGPFRIYFWKGLGSSPESVAVDHLDGYHPEAIVIYTERGLDEIQILSDDGKLELDGVPAKDLTNPSQKKFRSFWVVQ
jgi:hypothetical protein